MTAEKSALLLCGHGSRRAEAAAEFLDLVKKVERRRPGQIVTPAFLQFNSPSIADALQHMYHQGVRDIIVQPVMLYEADHVKNDIPEILARFRQDHPHIRLRYGAALGLAPAVIEAAVQVIKPFLKDDCEILVVGRGSGDRDVADQVINLCQKLSQQLITPHLRYCYCQDISPAVKTALEQAARSHYADVIVLPFLLFSGHLLAEITRKIDDIAEKYPACHFHKAPPLGSQDSIAEAILARVDAL